MSLCIRLADTDLPSVTDNGPKAEIEAHGSRGNLNNIARVNPSPDSPDGERRLRLMKKGGKPTPEELQTCEEFTFARSGSRFVLPCAPLEALERC